MAGYFDHIAPISYDPDSDGLAYRHYNPDEIVMGKRMEDHLRFAVCYWHNFVWEGNDPFGGQTFDRPWFPADTMDLARKKADAAFDMFRILG
ncbi:MAG: xylose isomerase, partial [Pseudomonadota bacterium]|nr:xylose isomerase [Pseudomonadota bacterium]